MTMADFKQIANLVIPIVREALPDGCVLLDASQDGIGVTVHGHIYTLLTLEEIEDGLHLEKDGPFEARLKLIRNGFSPEDVARLSASVVCPATLARLEARRKEYGFTEPAPMDTSQMKFASITEAAQLPPPAAQHSDGCPGPSASAAWRYLTPKALFLKTPKSEHYEGIAVKDAACLVAEFHAIIAPIERPNPRLATRLAIHFACMLDHLPMDDKEDIGALTAAMEAAQGDLGHKIAKCARGRPKTAEDIAGWNQGDEMRNAMRPLDHLRDSVVKAIKTADVAQAERLAETERYAKAVEGAPLATLHIRIEKIEKLLAEISGNQAFVPNRELPSTLPQAQLRLHGIFVILDEIVGDIRRAKEEKRAPVTEPHKGAADDRWAR